MTNSFWVIAKAAGISQAYLFRLFPTKPELFVAVCGVTRERMLSAFRGAAARARAAGRDPLEEMGQAYGELLERDRDVLLIQPDSEFFRYLKDSGGGAEVSD